MLPEAGCWESALPAPLAQEPLTCVSLGLCLAVTGEVTCNRLAQGPNLVLAKEKTGQFWL